MINSLTNKLIDVNKKIIPDPSINHRKRSDANRQAFEPRAGAEYVGVKLLWEQ